MQPVLVSVLVAAQTTIETVDTGTGSVEVSGMEEVLKEL
jgi:hypothetical protein